MPSLDCESYSLDGIEPAMAVLSGMLEEAGEDPHATPLSIINIYCGVSDLRATNSLPWHVCLHRPYGYLFVVFHHVEHGEVIKTTSPEIANCLGLCITLVWTTNNPTPEQIWAGIEAADEIVQAAELATGKPIPIPLKPMQLPDRFAIRVIDPGAAAGDRDRTALVLPTSRPFVVEANEFLVFAVGHQIGVLGPTPEQQSDPLTQAVALSATWQRRAIRALGVGEWPDAVVASNIWVETLMVRLAAILHEANGNPLQDIPHLVMKRGLASFANTYLGSPFLKGTWDHKRSDTPFGAWHAQCFLRRNEIVHTGKLVTADEAHTAYKAAHALAHEITRQAAKIKDPKLMPALKALREMAEYAEARRKSASKNEH
jgi:hypothetical protein